mmetsp:Transcript_23390/g.59885  ORF Transcript_23390/g.59885 Transcript_23390/m.59885 type:complete len:259 (+) Transcript_23390:193-969(+)
MQPRDGPWMNTTNPFSQCLILRRRACTDPCSFCQLLKHVQSDLGQVKSDLNPDHIQVRHLVRGPHDRDAVLAPRDAPVHQRRHSLGVHLVLLLEHARSQLLVAVGGQHGHRALRQDGPRVKLLVHKVHGGAGKARAACDDRLVHALAVHALAAERGQQAGVDVEHGARVRPDQVGRDELEVPSQDDVVGPVHRLEAVHQLGHRESREVTLLGDWVGEGGDAVLLGVLHASAGGHVTHHHSYLGIHVALLYGRMDCFHV